MRRRSPPQMCAEHVVHISDEDTILTSTPPTILVDLESNESDTPETSSPPSNKPADARERPTTNKSCKVRMAIKRFMMVVVSVDYCNKCVVPRHSRYEHRSLGALAGITTHPPIECVLLIPLNRSQKISRSDPSA